MATKSATEPRTPENLRALDALTKIGFLAEAAMALTANDAERSLQNELIGVICDIAQGVSHE